MRKNKEIAQDCETCTNHGTMDCPTSALCYSKQNHPYWMNKPMKENRVKIAISGIPIDRLEAICAAEKDGRLVTLPCKVGDTVYKISYDCTNRIRYNPFDENGCSTAEICLKCDTHPCDIHKTVIPVTVESKDWMWENKAAFGKTVFLTRAEAEKVLGKEAQS